MKEMVTVILNLHHTIFTGLMRLLKIRQREREDLLSIFSDKFMIAFLIYMCNILIDWYWEDFLFLICLLQGCWFFGVKRAMNFVLRNYRDRCQLQNRVFNWQAIFWATLWANGGRFKKSATWVFFRSDPFIFTRGDFARKWWIPGDFWDPLNPIFTVAAGKETVLSRNLPVQSSNWIFFWSLSI